MRGYKLDPGTPTLLDLGMLTRVPPGWTTEVAPFDLMGHKLDPGTPWVTPKVTPFDLFGLYDFGVWVCYVWTRRLNPKSLGLKHTGPK